MMDRLDKYLENKHGYKCPAIFNARQCTMLIKSQDGSTYTRTFDPYLYGHTPRLLDGEDQALFMLRERASIKTDTGIYLDRSTIDKYVLEYGPLIRLEGPKRRRVTVGDYVRGVWDMSCVIISGIIPIILYVTMSVSWEALAVLALVELCLLVIWFFVYALLLGIY